MYIESVKDFLTLILSFCNSKKFMYYVYILISLKDRKFYVGSTEDLVRRISEHKKGKVKSTKNRLPIKLTCYEAYNFKEEMIAREKFLKAVMAEND